MAGGGKGDTASSSSLEEQFKQLDLKVKEFMDETERKRQEDAQQHKEMFRELLEAFNESSRPVQDLQQPINNQNQSSILPTPLIPPIGSAHMRFAPMQQQQQNQHQTRQNVNKDPMGTMNDRRQSEVGDGESSSSRGKDTQSFPKQPKMDFPVFNGDNPRSWIKKCNKFFSFYQIPDHQKVDFVFMNMEGKAGEWFDSYILSKKVVTWDELILDVCQRFREPLGRKVVENRYFR